MTRRVWTWTLATAVLLVAAWMAGAAAIAAPRLRSEHSEPAVDPPAMVVINSDGKLFHRPGCAYVHGPGHTEAGDQALAEGYTPCTRCLPR